MGMVGKTLKMRGKPRKVKREPVRQTKTDEKARN